VFNYVRENDKIEPFFAGTIRLFADELFKRTCEKGAFREKIPGNFNVFG
jgi:hypothetical protein